MTQSTVLVVDDEKFVRDSLVDLLESEKYRVLTAAQAAEALATLGRESVQALVTDLSMPGGGGLQLLRGLRQQGFETPVVVLTGVGTVGDAVEAMKAGAIDFIQKPIAPDAFLHLVRRAVEHGRLVDELRYLRHAVKDLRGPVEMVGDSAPLRALRALIEQVAASDATVLISGESGTGKELVGAEIHRRSRRAERNLVRVNCAAVSESLFESEFFGHRRGAFTGASSDRQGRFAEAEGGTLILDEIGCLRPEMQAKLLRVLESGEYQMVGESRSRHADARVIAITNDNLEEKVRKGGFRPDLFYRLNVFPIAVPPLRARRNDIGLLARYLYGRLIAGRGPWEAGKAAAGIGDDAVAVLERYDWPGNVRELRNVIERAAILAGPRELDGAIFAQLLGSFGPRPTGSAAPDDLNIRRHTRDLEERLVRAAIERSHGRKRQAAELLGIDPKNMSYYLKKLGIESGEE